MSRLGLASLSLLLLTSCGNDDKPADPDAGFVCEFDLQFATGGEGSTSPLAAGPGEVRAGRIDTDDLPDFPFDLGTAAGGDYVIANDKFALIIEDVGDSDLYDPWGGRPVGLASIENGAMSTASNFGEFYILTESQTIITETVTVINDGSNGEAAVIRAEGGFQNLPFTTPVLAGLYRGDYSDMRGAIDYVLEPGSSIVDIYVSYKSPRKSPEEVASSVHGFMYTKRMRRFARNLGFEPEGSLEELGFIDENGPSYTYSRPGDVLANGIAVSGFAANLGPGFLIAECGETVRHHARLTIGGPGVDGMVQSLAAVDATELREITGNITDANGAAAEGVRLHATLADGTYLTRATTDASGNYSLHIPTSAAPKLTTYRVGDQNAEQTLTASESTADLQLAPVGFISVTSVDQDLATALPVRIQVIPTDQALPSVPNHYGEESRVQGRLHVEYSMDGTANLQVPVGDWEVIVSRGYEFELFSEIVSVSANNTSSVAAVLEHVIDTEGELCADFHIHTMRSADSGDEIELKVRSAVADGLELPVRSEHEFAADFKSEISALDVEDFAFGVPSVELTTMLYAGHFGVIPTLPDATKRNNNAPIWQTYADEANPNRDLETLQPPAILDAVRARPEAPAVIINHPRGPSNYFDYVDLDPITGIVGNPEYWDENFTMVEVFNDSSWQANLAGTVTDWFALLSVGRRIASVGSSDSHGIATSPVGYPRTCLDLGTDDTTSLTNNMVRDAAAAGESTVSGGIYLTATVNNIGPGGEATGLGATATLHLRVQAASWVDVDSIDLVVDGVISTIDILPSDADALNPANRFEKEIPIDVSTSPNAYVLVAAYGDSSLAPVHEGRIPFGVSNPIYLSR
ncbi:MAG: carboxypeptidase regulatory-like domain-containing protein [Myxococcales bacterium]|nr:carboxypeptidase regulatory-like domain-containing protein [Myxococcales bacterium]